MVGEIGRMKVVGGSIGTVLTAAPVVQTPTPTTAPSSTPLSRRTGLSWLSAKHRQRRPARPDRRFYRAHLQFWRRVRGVFGDCGITRVFSGPIQSIKVTIESGEAFDAGYVEGLLVTDIRSCGNEGKVAAPLDVTDAVSIVGGSTARLTLRAEEVCPFGSPGWGEEVQAGSSNARLHWQVAIGPLTPTSTPTPFNTATAIPTPIPTPRAYYDNRPR